MSIEGMSLDVLVNSAISTHHIARIKWLACLIRIELEDMIFSIIPAFTWVITSVVPWSP